MTGSSARDWTTQCGTYYEEHGIKHYELKPEQNPYVPSILKSSNMDACLATSFQLHIKFRLQKNPEPLCAIYFEELEYACLPSNVSPAL